MNLSFLFVFTLELFFFSAPPSGRLSLIVLFGGCWFYTLVHGLHYNGGRTRYIHNIDPSTFNLQELMTAALLLGRGDEVVPTQFWYHPHGRNWPSGLVTIDGEPELRDMWQNVTDHDEKAVVVVMQDTAWEENKKTKAIIYELPRSMTSEPRSLDIAKILKDAITAEMYSHAQFGPHQLWKSVTEGRSWHVTSNPVPMSWGFNVLLSVYVSVFSLFTQGLCF